MSWTNQTKNTATYTDRTKNSSTYTNQSKSVSGYDYLLKEDNGFLLQETGDKIILDQSSTSSTSWTNQSKN